ncbi:hypothetical protein JST97_18935 [bacterium]|nr:hypothetical protein [bacterium]
MRRLLILLPLLLAWTADWYLTARSHQQLLARSLGGLLGPEIQMGLESRPFVPGPGMARLNGDCQVDSARLLGADGVAYWKFGPADFYDVQVPVIESGQLLGRLELHFRPVTPPLTLAAAWLMWLAMLLVQRSAARVRSRSLVLEVDAQRRIRRLSGNSQLLARASGTLIGQSLDELMNGPLAGGRSLSQLSGSSNRSVVVVRDSEDLRKVKSRVRRLEAKYRVLCDSAHDLIVLLEPEGNLIFINRSLQERLAGANPTQLQQMFRPEQFEEVKEHLHNALLEGKSAQFETQLNGQIPVCGSFSKLEPEPDTPLSVLGIFRDLSAQRAAEAGLRQAQKMEAVGRLAGGVAHDLNNFLCIFSGLTALMREELEHPEAIQGYLGELDQAVESATELTRQLLHFTGKRGQEQQCFEVDTAVSEMASMACHMLGRKITLETSLNSRNRVTAERTQIDQVVLNLLVNARDAMPEGGRVRLTTRNRDPWTELTVRDEGTGMDAETAAHIFEPYFTTKEPGKGTGLGLSTVYAIVHSLGGKISVESQLGAGTTFTVLLPCA